jgi:hypothetical protein
MRSPLVWASAVWIAVLIHLDWHLGRPGPDRLSFGWPYHWLLAVVAFAPLPWLIARRWPTAFVRVSAAVIVLGVALGQGIEPLGEVVHSHGAAEPFANSLRWRVFAEFLAAGVLTFMAAAVAARRRSGVHGGKER